jgi:hypothetical protein
LNFPFYKAQTARNAAHLNNGCVAEFVAVAFSRRITFLRWQLGLKSGF